MTSYMSNAGTSAAIPNGSGNVKTAHYNLNHTKQVTKLVMDAFINDFEIVVSTTKQKINTLC